MVSGGGGGATSSSAADAGSRGVSMVVGVLEHAAAAATMAAAINKRIFIGPRKSWGVDEESSLVRGGNYSQTAGLRPTSSAINRMFYATLSQSH